MNKYSYPSISFIEYANYFRSRRDKYIRESKKFIKNESKDELIELINNQNNYKRIKSNFEQKLEMIALKKVYGRNDQSKISLTKSFSDVDFVIKIRKYFEIKNFLYSEYDFLEMRFIDDSELNNVFCLSLLSFNLMELYLDYLDFNYLNTAFKINDLLQNINPIDSSVKISYVLLVINKEKKILDKLINK
tara:strand:+ start:485 stop:1054 length:570 start_codon:yes stop_codon:yes gene_type:complete